MWNKTASKLLADPASITYNIKYLKVNANILMPQATLPN
jgi:hypothetical protein